jgi:hypothetical protein
MVVVIAIAVVIPIMAITIVVFLVAVVPMVVSTGVAIVIAVIGADDAPGQRDNARGQNAGGQDVQWFHRGSP